MVCLFGMFLAFHDIYHDYLSPKTLVRFGIGRDLPDWTKCPLEWGVAGVCFWSMVLLTIGGTVISFLTAFATKKN